MATPTGKKWKGMAFRIADEQLARDVIKYAEKSGRSVDRQVEYWAKIGSEVLRFPTDPAWKYCKTLARRKRVKSSNPHPLFGFPAHGHRDSYNAKKWICKPFKESANWKGLTVRIMEQKFSRFIEPSAKAEFRTVDQQLEYWTLIGKIAALNPDLSPQEISGTLVGGAHSEAGLCVRLNLKSILGEKRHAQLFGGTKTGPS